MHKYFIGVSMTLLIALAVSVLGVSAYQYHQHSEEMVVGADTLESLIQEQRESFQTTFYQNSGTWPRPKSRDARTCNRCSRSTGD